MPGQHVDTHYTLPVVCHVRQQHQEVCKVHAVVAELTLPLPAVQCSQVNNNKPQGADMCTHMPQRLRPTKTAPAANVLLEGFLSTDQRRVSHPAHSHPPCESSW